MLLRMDCLLRKFNSSRMLRFVMVALVWMRRSAVVCIVLLVVSMLLIVKICCLSSTWMGILISAVLYFSA